MSTSRMIAVGLLALVLCGPVVWALLQMAGATSDTFRLTKMALALGAIVVVAPLIFLALTPLHRRRRS